MNRLFLFTAGCLLSGLTMFAQKPLSEESGVPVGTDCEALISDRMAFLVDGSFQSERVPAREISKLKGCGIDDYDILFFGNMNAITSMLAKMTKSKEVHKLTYADLLLEINKVKQTDFYKNARDINLTSEALAKRVGSLQNWPEDEKLFNQLGSSGSVKNKVLAYLRENPENKKNYKEILESLKK
jgi:hypothetical protein